MSKYECCPVTGGDKFTVEADSYEFDNASRVHSFKDTDGNLVATQVNVNVRKLPDEA